MHFLMILLGLGLAWGIRYQWAGSSDSLSQRWQNALGVFLFSPLLLLMVAIAVLCMGPSGQMVGHWEGWLSYGLALLFLVAAIVFGIKSTWDARQTVQKMRQHSTIELHGQSARLLETLIPYSAQVGFWRSELVVSQGLLNTLDVEHLEAVLVHENAHAQYHDTFWFFWLGWVRRLTFWLPQTEELWQELLMLRELRADRYAAQQVDPLVLAEALLMVVSAPLMEPEICAAFSWPHSKSRLMERIDSLLENNDQSLQSPSLSMGWLLLVLLPLVVIPFHAG